MKRFLLKTPFFIICCLLAVMLSSCGIIQPASDSGVNVIPKSSPNGTDDIESLYGNLDSKLESLRQNIEDYIRSIIESRAHEILLYIKNKDLEMLAEAVNPEKGLRFSMYFNISTAKDLVFGRSQVKELMADETVYKWGVYDGSGEPVELTFPEYYKRFVYDEDFVDAPQVGYNKIIGTGNIIDNTFDVYSKAIVVEYHFPGFNPEYEGMDWASLKLVFEKVGGTWYLTGVIHGEWTI